MDFGNPPQIWPNISIIELDGVSLSVAICVCVVLVVEKESIKELIWIENTKRRSVWLIYLHVSLKLPNGR